MFRPSAPSLVSGIALLSTLVLCACAMSPKHEYELLPGRAHRPELQTALLVRINTTDPPLEGLEKGEEEIFGLIQTYLEQRGLRLKVAEGTAHQEAANAAVRKARDAARSGQSGSVARELRYADLVPHIVEQLAAEADLVIVPNMVLSAASFQGNVLRWDGVRRRNPGVGALRMSGNSNAASLHVAIYEADGTRVFAGYGGLDVIWGIDIGKRKMELIPDRLENTNNLRQGVCVAFHPYFGDEPCTLTGS